VIYSRASWESALMSSFLPYRSRRFRKTDLRGSSWIYIDALVAGHAPTEGQPLGGVTRGSSNCVRTFFSESTPKAKSLSTNWVGLSLPSRPTDLSPLSRGLIRGSNP
jgi:hypothetical protein